jgi:hypothetical protein
MRSLALGLALWLPSLSADALTLADNGRAKLPIVVTADAGEEVRALAAELAGFLQRISGAKFAVVTNRPAHGIFLGTQKEFPLPAFANELAITNSFDGVEAFVVHPQNGSLHLIGATAKGTPHAVFTLLDRLGCRWFFPAAEWEIIPKRNRIDVDFTIADRPRILSRRIAWGFGLFDRRQGKCQADHEGWARRNRMAQSFRTYTGHAWQAIILENRETFAAHPEYLALVKGERRGHQLCVSNPGLRRVATDWALKRLADRPHLDMVSMETADGLNHCECEPCVALGSVSDRAFGLANEVARAVTRKHPGKMVGMLAYSDHSVPPTFHLEPNVYVQSTAGYIHGRYSFEELMRLWPEKTAHYGFYEYYSVWQWDHDQLPGGRANDLTYLQRRIRQYRDVGATSLLCESSNSWGVHGRGYYVANRLAWNPDLDADALLQDFYQRAFGSAAAVVRRFYERFDRGNNPLMSTHLLGLGFRDLDEASRLADQDDAVQARLRHLKQYLHYVRLRWDIDHSEDQALRKRATLAALTWCHRTRYSYMNHWAAMWQSWSKSAAKEFNEPEWSAKLRRETYAWSDETPVSAAETERVFQADLEHFQPQDVAELNFAGELIHPDLPDPDRRQVKTRPLSHRFQKSRRYAIASRRGEDIVFRIRTGVIKGYRNRPEAKWRISKPNGQLLKNGHLPLDGEYHEVRFAPAQSGVFDLEIDDSGAGFNLDAEPGTPITLRLERAKRVRHMGQFKEPVFFQVPKGTRQLQFYWEGGRMKPRLHDPTGRVVAEITDNGTYVTVDIPAGMDGQPWHFTRFAPRHFWLANAPNHLAASPSALILPKDAVTP